MKAMVLKGIQPIEKRPLEMADLPIPQPNHRQILVKISACGVCHTELDEIEGMLNHTNRSRACLRISPMLCSGSELSPGHSIVEVVHTNDCHVNVSSSSVDKVVSTNCSHVTITADHYDL